LNLAATGPPLSFWLECEDDHLIAAAIDTLSEIERRNQP
jgi:hypothetical protein